MSTYHIGVAFGISSAFTATAVILWSREIQHREGPWRYMVLVTLGPAILGLVSWVAVSPDWSAELVNSALITSLPMLLGVFLLGLALRKGHASHVAPVMGAKVLIVTGLAALFGFEPVQTNFWLAAVLLFVALFLINGNPEIFRKPWQVLDVTLCTALVSCLSYSVADLLTRQRMAVYELGLWDFVTVSWVIRGTLMLTVYLIARAIRPFPLLPARPSTFWAGAPLYSLHGFVIIAAFKYTNSAIITNVLTNLRGVVSVFAVLILARFGMTRNETMSGPLFGIRLAGSLLVCIAVYIALQ